MEWKPYELRPGLPPEGIRRDPKPGEVDGLQPHLIECAEEVGLSMKRPPTTACSRPALEAAEYAKEQGKFDQFHLAIFKAYWESGKNIGLITILRELAQESGLDANELEHRLADGHYSQLVIHESEQAKQMGINGIPAYIIGGCLIEGVQPYQVFQRAIETALRK